MNIRKVDPAIRDLPNIWDLNLLFVTLEAFAQLEIRHPIRNMRDSMQVTAGKASVKIAKIYNVADGRYSDESVFSNPRRYPLNCICDYIYIYIYIYSFYPVICFFEM